MKKHIHGKENTIVHKLFSHRRWLRVSTSGLYLVSLLLGSLLSLHAPAQAGLAAAGGNSIKILGITQKDLNGDGRVDMTIIDCSFVTAHDRIYVIDQGNDMQVSNDWHKATDFTDDIWLYDINADGSIQLIVKYQEENGRDNAYVYDDQDNDGKVKYVQTGKNIQILESSYFTAHFISGSHWTLSDGRTNLNLRIDLDGPIPTMDRVPMGYVQDWMKHDGQIDVEFEEAAGADGVASYALKRLLTASPPDMGFERAGIYSNEGQYTTGFYERAFFPFLPVPIDPHDPKYLDLRYFDLPPNLTVDWEHGKVQGVGLDGYPIGQGYHFNDNRYILKGQVNDVSFETPHAYYDLAGDHDSFPDMHIRFFTHPAKDQTTWSYNEMQDIPWQSIDYDWNLFNPGTLTWDFKVGLGGNYPINSVIKFPDFSVHMIPYAELPYWITERQWKMATFVAREGKGYQSSEGIYEWQADTGDNPEGNPDRAIQARSATAAYMLGITANSPDDYFQTTLPGFRAERHFASPVQPYLYISPIDHKLHLLGAENGIWTIDDKKQIRYSNLNGDNYLDQWQYFENDRLVSELDVAGSFLIYTDANGAWMKKAAITPSLFQTLPPRNHQEWLELGNQLKANQPVFASTDLKAMYGQFTGQEWQLSGARLYSFRPDGKGYRIILQSKSGFTVRRIDASGSQFSDSAELPSLTPPDLSAYLIPIKPAQLQVSSISISLRNNGLEDVPKAELELWAASSQVKLSEVVTQTVSLLSQAPITATLQWSPSSAGEWTLIPMIRQPDGEVYLGKPAQVTVQPAGKAAPVALLLNSTSPLYLPMLLFGLLTFAAIASTAFWWFWRR